MAHRNTDRGFTLIEILIVVVIMAVLAATIIPQFGDSTKDARKSTAQYNLRGLRTQLEVYKSRHDSEYPTRLGLLTKKTNEDHTESGGTLGPYCFEIPGDGVTGNEMVTAGTSPLSSSGTSGGWLYDKDTGEIRINHQDYDDF